MGFEIPLDSDYIDHPKTQHLLKLIGPEADVYPIRLWTWASKYARDGKVKTGWRGVEAACRWSGRPKRLSRALVTSGFLETDGHTIHDWMNGVGRAIAIYERKKQKQREKYRISVGLPPEDLLDSSGIHTEDHRQSSPNPSNPSNPVNPSDPSEGKTDPLPPLSIGNSSTGPTQDVMRLLMQRAKAAKIPNRPDTLRQYLEAWVARSSGIEVERILMLPESRGRTVIEIQDANFKNNGKRKEIGAPAPPPVEPHE